ncbi:MAG TPA: monofunctional biosynthetic peptidoglycan transglycosylase [Methylomirabilota bacterium]|nr:monofunctional biosynthetic peptidoglycan transglycosylase [Methylomirabilota bacterium]
MAREGRGRQRGRAWRRLALLALVAAIAWLGYEAWTWPRVSRLATGPPRTTAFIEAFRAEQRAAGRDGRVQWTWVPYSAVSIHVKRAVVVAEDIRFFAHGGVDLDEVEEALGRAVERKALPRGASTITQQLAKNLWLTPSRSPLRKARELVLAWQLERTLTKRRILELYLNVAELGPGCYGVEAGARRYFTKSAADVGPFEAAQLAASLPNPRAWHPGSTSRTYQTQVARVLRRMDRAVWLDRLL